MKEFKGTRGKWEVVVGDDGAPDVISDIGAEIAFTPTYNGDKTEQWHNAKLIAASPELLTAIQQLLEVYDDQSGKVWTTSSKRRALDNARAAVNKAVGE
ncbi:TPA: hypothetical protein ACW5FR_001697 [Salmonella enterica]